MPKEEINYSQYQTNNLSKIREIEEKQRLLKDRILLIGETHIKEREKTFKEMQELKKTVVLLKEENSRIKQRLENITRQINYAARKEELAILQRQFDLFRE